MCLLVYVPKKTCFRQEQTQHKTCPKAQTDRRSTKNMVKKAKIDAAQGKRRWMWIHIHHAHPPTFPLCWCTSTASDGYYARAGEDENKEIKTRCRPLRCQLVYAHASSRSSAVERVIMICLPGGRGIAHFQTLAVKEIMQDLFSTNRWR